MENIVRTVTVPTRHNLSHVRVEGEAALVQQEVDRPVAGWRLAGVYGGVAPLCLAQPLPENVVRGQLLPHAGRQAQVCGVQILQDLQSYLRWKVAEIRKLLVLR